MPCFRGSDFPVPSVEALAVAAVPQLAALPPEAVPAAIQTLPAVVQTQLAQGVAAATATQGTLVARNLWFCTANEVGGSAGCDGECVAVLIIAGIALLLALYDAYHIQTCMKPLIAVRRHLVVLFLSAGLYSALNAMDPLFPANYILWDGLRDFLRIFFVYHYTLYLLSIVFIDGYGDVEELIEKAGAFFVSNKVGGGKGAAWIDRCFLLVHVWMVEVIISYVIKTVADSHLVYTALDITTQRLHMWDGALIYIAIVDAMFTIICGLGVGQLANMIKPFLLPKLKQVVMARHMLFLFFYYVIAFIYPSIINFIFAANVGVSDEQYTWWTRHKPMFVATHLLVFQYGMHKAFVPPYQWGFGRSELMEIRSKLQSRADVGPFLDELAQRGFVLSSAMEKSLPALTPAAMTAEGEQGPDAPLRLDNVHDALASRGNDVSGVYGAQYAALEAAEKGLTPKRTPSARAEKVDAEHIVADAVFDKVAGPGVKTIDLKSLAKYLIDRGDMPLERVQSLFDTLECALHPGTPQHIRHCPPLPATARCGPPLHATARHQAPSWPRLTSLRCLPSAQRQQGWPGRPAGVARRLHRRALQGHLLDRA